MSTLINRIDFNKEKSMSHQIIMLGTSFEEGPTEQQIFLRKAIVLEA